jgi:hypothetical protein
MKSLDIPIVITPTLTLPHQRRRGIPGLPDENELRYGMRAGLARGSEMAMGYGFYPRW